jgi:molybdopterin biosynthesis enzyme MoaB
MLSRFRNLCMATMVVVLVGGTGFAQKDMGSILGTVRDTSGAVVQGAKVTVRCRSWNHLRDDDERDW